MNDTFKNMLLAAVGGAALSYEKAKELVDEMVDKGKITVQQGRDLTEDLKQTVKGEKKDSENKEDTVEELTAEVIRLKQEIADLSDKVDNLSEGQQEDEAE